LNMEIVRVSPVALARWAVAGQKQAPASVTASPAPSMARRAIVPRTDIPELRSLSL